MMVSTLAWLDHDGPAQDRAKRILALFQERSTQDQLGLGGVRDSFAELFFPGTSTIQTRLRYFLFIPWIYRQLEEKEVPSSRIAAVARERELALLEPLLASGEEGVFGRTAGGDLKRLPSEVYWGGLGSWRIRRFDASRAQYHRRLNELYRQRRSAAGSSSPAGDATDAVTWHPELPAAPDSFPVRADFAVTREEAEFIRDRIVAEHEESLLAWLALHPTRTEMDFPWEHPYLDRMKPDHRRSLWHARTFSSVMAGAPILYNRLVSEELGAEELIEEYRVKHEEWLATLEPEDLERWDLDALFALLDQRGTRSVTPHAENFIRRWTALVREDPAGLQLNDDARNLVRRREIRLKAGHSLFTNRRAREELYRGGLGLARLSYRWSNVQVLLNDLGDGLGRA